MKEIAIDDREDLKINCDQPVVSNKHQSQKNTPNIYAVWRSLFLKDDIAYSIKLALLVSSFKIVHYSVS